jgi:outer membrane protein assembly factor BamA
MTWHFLLALWSIAAEPLLGAEPAQVQPASQTTKAPAAPIDPQRTEAGLVPLIGGDTDIGVGVGALGSIAKFDDLHEPYQLRVEALGLISFRASSVGKGLEVPFQDYNVTAVAPGLAGGRIRLRFRIAFLRFSTTPYFGIGNASQVNFDIFNVRRRYHQFDRIAPSAQAEMLVTLVDKLQMRVGLGYSHNWVTAYPETKLTEDLPNIRGVGVYGIPQVFAGLLYDSRDHEFVPRRGGYHELTMRLSPGPMMGQPFLYGSLLASARQYQSIYRDYFVIAGRVLVEGIVGDAPFFELGQYDAGAIGGGNAIRGVPLMRYYGKLKMLANLELRSMFVSFPLLKQRFAIGAVAFFDAGRVFADYRFDPVVDGRGLGLKWGTGGGLRLQWGDTFVLRADVAWSPDALPIGFYFNAGQAF